MHFVFSKNEADASGDGAGFWSNEVVFEEATHFVASEVDECNLPLSRENDARWIASIEAMSKEGETTAERPCASS